MARLGTRLHHLGGVASYIILIKLNVWRVKQRRQAYQDITASQRAASTLKNTYQHNYCSQLIAINYCDHNCDGQYSQLIVLLRYLRTYVMCPWVCTEVKRSH